MQEKYNVEDLEFRKLNFQFINDYYNWLIIVRNCNNNPALKYISNFKNIINISIHKGILTENPFRRFKKKRVRIKKKPLTAYQLGVIQGLEIAIPRLDLARDVFIFQCHTGLAYADVYLLKKKDIITGIDGELWISSRRKKTKAETDIPLLPVALGIIDKHKDDPTCLKRQSVLPVLSNQKMNSYLKEIATLVALKSSACLNLELNTHKGRRTFASTVALKNGVPIDVVRDLLGHESFTQTEEYAITEQETIGQQMQVLKTKLSGNESETAAQTMEEMAKEIKMLKECLFLLDEKLGQTAN